MIFLIFFFAMRNVLLLNIFVLRPILYVLHSIREAED